MNERQEVLEIEVLYDHREYTPGDSLSGTLRWLSEPDPVEDLYLRLFWYTEGRGTRDSEVVHELAWSGRGRSGGQEAFAFQLPRTPFTFSGSLISLTWALEAVLKPSNHSTIFEFTLSPTGKEIRLAKIEDATSRTAGKWARTLENKFRENG